MMIRFLLSMRRRDLEFAYADIMRGVRAWNIWHILAMQELRQRYRRSTLGPWWISISLGIQVGVMVFLVAVLFRQEFHKYMPYAVLGLIFWNFLSSSLMESASCYVAASPYLLQREEPLFAFIIHVLWRNLIILAHTIFVYVIVAVIFKVPLTAASLLVIPGLVLFVGNLIWMMLLLSVIAARFRDVHLMLQASMSVLFWVTPIIYFPTMLGSFVWIAEYNPITHWLEVARSPILGAFPPVESCFVAMGTLVVGWALTFLFFARFRERIVYWL